MNIRETIRLLEAGLPVLAESIAVSYESWDSILGDIIVFVHKNPSRADLEAEARSLNHQYARGKAIRRTYGDIYRVFITEGGDIYVTDAIVSTHAAAAEHVKGVNLLHALWVEVIQGHPQFSIVGRSKKVGREEEALAWVRRARKKLLRAFPSLKQVYGRRAHPL